MDPRSKIPALALLGLSFTQCTGREQPADPIIGDWRAIQVDGEKRPDMSYGVLRGEQLRIDDDLAGEMARYGADEFDGLDYHAESVSDLVVDASGAPKYRIDVAHDLFEDRGYPNQPADPTGYADGGYADLGDDDDDVRPLKLPTAPDLAGKTQVFDCTLDGDTLTCDRQGATELKHWVFARIEPDDT